MCIQVYIYIYMVYLDLLLVQINLLKPLFGTQKRYVTPFAFEGQVEHLFGEDPVCEGMTRSDGIVE